MFTPYQKKPEFIVKAELMMMICLLLLLVLPVLAKALPEINFTYNGDENVTANNVTATIYKTNTFNISFVNTGNVSITNLSCYPLSMFNCSLYEKILAPGQNDFFYYDVSTNQIFSQTTYIINTNFLYLTPFLQENNNYTILINDYGINMSPFNPQNLTVIANDNIKWENNDNVTHTITVLSGTNNFDIILSSGQSYSFSPATVETIEYYDRITGKNAFINILNNTAFYSTHNNEYDKTFNVNLESNHELTQLTADLYTNDFTINYNDAINGVFLLTNTMNEIAYNIKLSMNTDFVSTTEFFPQNKSQPFNLDSNESVIVLFNNHPLITDSGETGKSYNATIRVASDNTNELIKSFGVVVRFSDIINETGCDIDWQGRIQFCRENPTSVYCLTEPLIVNKTVVEYVPLLYYTNFSEVEVRQAFLDRPTCEQILERLSNRFDTVTLSLQNSTISLNHVNNVIDSANTEMYENMRNETAMLKKDLSFVKMVYPVGIVLFAIVVVIIIFIVKAYKGRDND